MGETPVHVPDEDEVDWLVVVFPVELEVLVPLVLLDETLDDVEALPLDELEVVF